MSATAALRAKQTDVSPSGRLDGLSQDGGRMAHECDDCWGELIAEIRQCREALAKIGNTLSAARDALRWAGEVQDG